MTNKIVFLLGSYYPNYSAVGRCQGNIADELEKQGYDITVIAEKSKFDEADSEMLGNQRIIRITNNHLSKRMRFSNRKDLLGRTVNQCLRVKEAIDKIVGQDSLRRYKALAYYNALKSLDFVPDVIVPTCLPFETVVAAAKYKQELKCCRVIPVLYDMFAENTGLTLTSWNKKMKKRSNLSIESKAFEDCDRILHMPSWTPHVRKYHANILSKTKEVEHPLIKEPNIPCEKIFTDGINLAFTGVVDNVIRNPQPVLDLFLNNKFPDVIIHFYVMGNASGKIEDASKHSSSIEYHGKVDSIYAHNVITEANILVSIGNNVPDQFPSKIFEYMSTGKPIIHFYHIENDPAIEVLKKYPLSLCVPADNIQYENVKAFINENNQKTLDFKTVRNLFLNASPEIISLMVTEKFGGGITLLFAGALNKNHVEPDVYIELMKRVHHKGLFKTLFFSSGNVANRLDNKEIIGLSHMTWIPHEKLKLELQNADVLLSLSQLQGKQISSKIFEYMSYGKPILHIYYKDDDINLNYLKKYPLALLLKADCITEENVNSIEDLLIQLSWLTIAFNNLADDFKCMTPQYIVNELIK